MKPTILFLQWYTILTAECDFVNFMFEYSVKRKPYSIIF